MPWETVMGMDLEQFDGLAQMVAETLGRKRQFDLSLAATAAQGSSKGIKDLMDSLGNLSGTPKEVDSQKSLTAFLGGASGM